MEFLSKLIIPFGIAAYTMMAITAISGMRGIKLRYHKMMGLTALALGTLHAALVFYIYF